MKTKDILKELTIEEKVKWTSGNSMWTYLGNERLGIEEIIVADGPHGLRAYKEKPSNALFSPNDLSPTTLFPSASAMASTFNENLLFEVGKSIGEECNMHSVDILLAPGINLKRSPLGGRNFEYYSEDPYLTTRCAINYVNGVQSTGVGACIKHFALNEQENQRRFLNTIVDDRTMHEMYLYPFYKTIKEANPFSIMSSYNKINDDYATESSHLLKDILRDKWGFEGIVISDWGAAQDKVKSIKNGLNIEMPGPSEFTHKVFEALKNNDLTEDEIDQSLMPLLALRERILLNKNKGKKADLDMHHHTAYNVAKEAIVLLENDGILPLEKNTKIAVVGAFAKEPRMNGGGSATVLPHKVENPLVELETLFKVEYAKGYEEENTTDELLKDVVNVVQNNEIIIYFTGTTEKLESEGKEREHMNLPEGHLEVFKAIAKQGKKVIVVLNNGSTVNVSPLIGHANAIIEAWMLGSANAKALVEIITGDVNPSGRLSETFPIRIEHTPHFGDFPSKTDEVNYSGDIIRHGYRYYDTHKYPVRYPFGYGLSYTTFEYSNLTVSNKEVTYNEVLEVKVTLKNTGKVTGKEVVQLYVQDLESYYPRPEKELKAFTKIELQPGEERTVTLNLEEDAFSVYAPDFKDFKVEAGTFNIYVGSNINNLPLVESIEFITDVPIRTTLSIQHPLKNFAIYKKEAFDKIVKEYREFPWYEIEEPAIRVLNRIKHQYKLDDETFDKIIRSLIE